MRCCMLVLTREGIVDRTTRTVGYPCTGDPEHPVARNWRNSVYACDGPDGEGFEGDLGVSLSSLSESDSFSSSLSASASSVHAFE